MVKDMKIKTLLNLGLSAVVLAAGFSGTADAALLSRAGGTMVYDDVANLTWITDANLFKTQVAGNPNLVSQIIAAVPTVHDTPNIYDTPSNSGTYNVTANEFNTTNGRMTWFGAVSWADGLVYGGYNDWRVPTGQAGCPAGLTCTNSEMASWFAAVGGVPGSDLVGSPLSGPPVHGSGFNLFSNVESYTYWTAAEVPGLPYMVYGYLTDGYQGAAGKNAQNVYLPTLLVRTGDVAAVPIPAAVWLFGTALAGLGVFGRRKGVV